MVSTLGPPSTPGGAADARRVRAFVPGALVGGVLTFGVLAALGAVLGGGGTALLAAAASRAPRRSPRRAGVRIAPQIRRQVPEHWRRVLPLPVAAAGYGVLLGLGFTTFVLTFAVPALAGVALAVGDVATGVLVGLAFGAGRSLPVVVLAPFAAATAAPRDRLMAERPAILRGFRAADALALALCAAVIGVAPAQAQTPAIVATEASVPAATANLFAFQRPGAPASCAVAAGRSCSPVATPRSPGGSSGGAT